MKKLFLTSVAAALLLANTAADAAGPKFKLSGEIIGTWCKDNLGGVVPVFSPCDEENDTHDWVTITAAGWSGIESSCSIISGEIIGSESAGTKTVDTNPIYKVKAKCYTEGFNSVETHTIVVMKGRLQWREAVVFGTPSPENRAAGPVSKPGYKLTAKDMKGWAKWCGPNNERCDPSDAEDNNWGPPPKTAAEADRVLGSYDENCWGEGVIGTRDGSEAQAAHDRCMEGAEQKGAAQTEPKWWTDCRHGWITKEFEEIDEDGPITVMGTSVRITYDEFRNLVKELPSILRELKACDAYRKCLEDRDAGKVKHCYENDRRWRQFITGAW
jgi:hypothetical protein